MIVVCREVIARRPVEYAKKSELPSKRRFRNRLQGRRCHKPLVRPPGCTGLVNWVVYNNRCASNLYQIDEEDTRRQAVKKLTTHVPS